MILELDCGNSFIKWRVIGADGLGRVGAGIVDSDARLFADLAALPNPRIDRCRLVSVRSDAETAQLIDELRATYDVKVDCVQSARQVGSVRNGYEDYQQLGLDRWLAVLGAYHLGQRACLVLDLGTAVTADWISSDGVHLGGFICPGISLLRSQLHAHTQRIRYSMDEAPAASCTLEPGRTTVEAVERGCLSMLHSFVSTQIRQAGDRFGAAFSVYATGGDAGLIKDIGQVQRIPDLVFRGLAIACP